MYVQVFKYYQRYIDYHNLKKMPDTDEIKDTYPVLEVVEGYLDGSREFPQIEDLLPESISLDY